MGVHAVTWAPRHRVAAIFLVIALALVPLPAFADHCGSPADCYFTARTETAVAVAIGVLVGLMFFFWAVPLLLELAAADIAIGAGAAVVIGLGRLAGGILGRLVGPIAGGLAAFWKRFAGVSGPVVTEEVSGAVLPEGTAAAEQIVGEVPASNVLQFGEDDLVYGPSAGGSLRALQEQAGGRLLTDIGGPAPGQSWIDFSKGALDAQVRAGGNIRFDLTNMQDVPGVLNGSGQFANTVTGQELQYIQANWARFSGNVTFYNNGVEVPPPW